MSTEKGSLMHWFVCNDARKTVRGVDMGGSALRAGRFFLYAKSAPRLKAFWSFFHSLNCLEVALKFGGEDSAVGFSLILPRLAHLGVGFSVPRRWLSWWMTDDRVFAVKVGYVSSIVRLLIAHADWAEDCGMTSYYRSQCPGRYTDLQLWPGYELVLRWPPVLRWLFGKATTEKEILETKGVGFEMDGQRYEATWSLERWSTSRPYWPWPYRVRISSYIDVPKPPRFAGKGESAHDCGDDAIYGMGSRETSPAKAVGEYIKRVLEYRERYGPAATA